MASSNSASEIDFERLSLNDRKIIVGIDFGTTYSGIAWAETMRPERRDAITTWPVDAVMREGESSQKVPTRLRYTDTDGKSTIEWGFAIDSQVDDSEVVKWFKLGLDDTYAEDTITSTTHRKPVDQLIADYMSALGEHLYHILGIKLGAEVINDIPFEFVITVPAIWTDSVKDRMIKACKNATGLRAKDAKISLVSEPEAAAIFALHGLDPHGLKVGESFVVCDAGGGTPVLEVKEAAPGDGGLYGSTFLNKNFAALLKERLGQHEDFDEEVLASSMDFFEKFKRQFLLDTDNATYLVPVLGMGPDRDLGITRSKWKVSGKELKERVFEPVIQEVVRLVEEQIFASEVPIKAVCLVGGFGSSVYLRQRLEQSLDDGISVMQPPGAWTAVVMGAVMKGLAASAAGPTLVQIAERCARNHYGHELSVVYDKNKHKHIKHLRYWDKCDGYFRVKVIQWLIRRGETVSENEPFYRDFSIYCKVVSGRPWKLDSEILCDNKTLDAPLLRNDNAKHICTVSVNLAKIPEEDLDKQKGVDGELYYRMDLKLETVFRSAETEYTLIYKGQRYDTVKAEYV